MKAGEMERSGVEGREGREDRVDSGSRGAKEKTPKETITEKCKQSPREFFGQKEPKTFHLPVCPLSLSPLLPQSSDRAGLPGNRGPAETVSGRRGAERR